MTLSLDPTTSALLVMDYQSSIVDGYAGDKEALLERTARLIGAARSAGLQVMYVVVQFREGYPEVNPLNTRFSRIKGSQRLIRGASDGEVHPAVAPAAGEIVVEKHRVNAFAGTDLEMILRSNGIQTLLFAGIATSGVVLSTLRHAADADYGLVVVADCCADRDPEVHRVLTEKVFVTQASVVTAEDVIAALAG